MGNWQNQGGQSKSALGTAHAPSHRLMFKRAVPFLRSKGFLFLNSQQKNIARAGKQKLNSQPFIWSPAWIMTAENAEVPPVPETVAAEGTQTLHFPTS